MTMRIISTEYLLSRELGKVQAISPVPSLIHLKGEIMTTATKTKTTPVEGVIQADLLATFTGLRANNAETVQANAIAFMRASLAFTVLDRQATIAEGNKSGKLEGIVQSQARSFDSAILILDTVKGAFDLSTKDLLTLALRGDKGLGTAKARETIVTVASEGKTVIDLSGVKADKATGVKETAGIFPASNPTKPRAPRGNTLPSLIQLSALTQAVIEAIPADLAELTDLDLSAIASMASAWAGLARKTARKVA